MDNYSPAQPTVVIANNAIVPINKSFSFITFSNNGAANGTIDFGSGNVCTLVPGESLSLPYLGRVYGAMTIDATGTLIQAIYVY
jgi:hypothetical protein